ncbi:IST1 homolog [Babylonia areolata]|uniref:IST1 homolog n=1 Tax=Babylonia areolata TaxID=304850 RepID=UPI003FD1EEC3
MFKSGPNYSKLKTNLRLTINRLKLLEKKKTELALKARKEIADYISAGKEDRARIRVEHIIREDYLVEAMELLEMYCDLLLARFGLIQTQKELDPGLEEAIASLIWATPRLQADIMEFKPITEEFSAKYGKEFAQACRSNSLSNVSEKVLHKLSVQAPPKTLVEQYMVEIAKSYSVPFEPDASLMGQDEIMMAENLLIDFGAERNGKGGGGPSGGLGVMQPVPSSQAPYPAAGAVPPPLPSAPPSALPSHTPFSPPQAPPPVAGGLPAYPGPHHYQPPPPTQMSDRPPDFNDLYTDGGPPSVQPPPSAAYMNLPVRPAGPPPKMDDTFPDLPTVPTNSLPESRTLGDNSAGGEDVDFDDLTRRFEALKKRK